MTKSFNCASCSAPLEFKGMPTQECDFCGGTVIAPSELFPSGSVPLFGFTDVTGKAMKVAEIKRLIDRGNKIEAIKVFRETFGVGLKEAKDAVEAMERGESVGISGMHIRTSGMNPETVDAAKKIAITSIGGIAAVLIISIVVITGMVGAILYFAVSSVQKAEELKKQTTQPLIGQTQTKDEGQKDTTELMKIGGEGNGAGKFKDNRHVAVDGQGRIYSSDYSPFRIQVFDPTGKFLTQWKPEKGANLYDLAADTSGNLFVANDKGLFKFAGESGELLASAEKIYPQGIALTWDNKVVVTAGKSLVIFDKNLKIINEIKDAAERANSTFGFEAVAVDGEGSIFVLDRHNGDICKFSPDGKFLNRFPTGTTAAHALAVDPKGRIFLSNTSDVLVFDASGQKVKQFDTYQAFGITFDQAGDLFIATRPHVTKLKLNF